jgi:hypothetical protein
LGRERREGKEGKEREPTRWKDDSIWMLSLRKQTRL